MSKSLRVVLPEIRCWKIVVLFDVFADLLPVVANDENQFRKVRNFGERFKNVVEDRPSRNMYERLRGGKGVGSESGAAARGRDNDFH